MQGDRSSCSGELVTQVVGEFLEEIRKGKEERKVDQFESTQRRVEE